MSAWRTKALELFPEMRSEVESAQSAGVLWIELISRFREFYNPVSETQRSEPPNLIRNICMFAIWCTRVNAADVQQGAWIEFYEGVPQFAFQSRPSVYKRIIRDLVSSLGISEVEKSTGTMLAHLTAEQQKKFMADLEQAEYERQRRSSKRHA
jgi:hypothetical protein